MFLSGGIDSSAVVSLAAQHLDPSQIRTFAIGFDEPSYDESAFARDIAHRLGTEHGEQVLDLAIAKSVVPEILERLDDPIADPSIVPTYLLSRFTRQYVTVALSGDGGDELFAGYDPFDAIRPAQIYNAVVPDSLHRITKFLADRLPRSRRNMSLDFKIRRALVGLSYDPKVQMPAWMSPLEPSDIAELLREPVSVEDLYSEAITIWQESRTGSPVDRMLEFFTRIYLQDDILPKVDRASMMVSLEVRAVFLDNDLVDFCRRLPNRFKYRNGTRKYLLKKALSGTLPDTTINRKKKGFGMPVSEWLMSIPKVPPMHGFGRTNIDLARQYWNQHRAGSHDHRLFLWSWLAMQNAFKNTGLASSA